MAAQPYKISIAESQIDDLKQRLALARFPDELDEAAWDYGSPLKDVKRLALYWKDTYDWRTVESRLNALPNYKASIAVKGFGELDLHFLHQTSDPDAVPLLFCHGWVRFCLTYSCHYG